jgi:hypothetical protein
VEPVSIVLAIRHPAGGGSLTSITRAGLLVCALLMAGCGGVTSLTADHSVTITSPSPLSTVSTPFVISWTSTRHQATYALFLDQVPISPGQTLSDLADEQCKHQPGCPDASYLAGLGIYITQSNQVTIPTLSAVGGTTGQENHPVHTATIVILNSQMRRVGESAWQVEFHA